MTEELDRLDFDYPDCLRDDFGEHLPLAIAVVDDLLGWMKGVDFSPLARRSLGLKDFDWANYLRCSIARMVHVAAALSRRHARVTRPLDYGSYFGNFALMLRRMGAAVDAIDSYRAYDGVFDRGVERLHREGVRTFDFADVGYDLHALKPGTYDLVLCLGVIEHIPDTPRFLLEGLNRVLCPGGVLVIDTPNLVHLYNRVKVLRGESVMPELPAQYYSQRPFEGHHREYTMPELVWMVRQIGHRAISVEAFNYSSYGLGTLVGRDVVNHWAMVRDPSLRELVMTVSQKPAGSPSDPLHDDAAEPRFEDPETFWLRAMPPTIARTPDALAADQETMIASLQAEVNKRDGLLADRDAEVAKRDHLLTDLQGEVDRRDRLLVECDALLSDLRRKLDLVTGRTAVRAIRRIFRTPAD